MLWNRHLLLGCGLGARRTAMSRSRRSCGRQSIYQPDKKSVMYCAVHVPKLAGARRRLSSLSFVKITTIRKANDTSAYLERVPRTTSPETQELFMFGTILGVSDPGKSTLWEDFISTKTSVFINDVRIGPTRFLRVLSNFLCVFSIFFIPIVLHLLSRCSSSLSFCSLL